MKHTRAITATMQNSKRAEPMCPMHSSGFLSRRFEAYAAWTQKVYFIRAAEDSFKVDKMGTLDKKLMNQLCKNENMFQDSKVARHHSRGGAFSDWRKNGKKRLLRLRECLQAFGQSLDKRRTKQADNEAEHNSAIGRPKSRKKFTPISASAEPPSVVQLLAKAAVSWRALYGPTRPRRSRASTQRGDRLRPARDGGCRISREPESRRSVSDEERRKQADKRGRAQREIARLNEKFAHASQQTQEQHSRLEAARRARDDTTAAVRATAEDSCRGSCSGAESSCGWSLGDDGR